MEGGEHRRGRHKEEGLSSPFGSLPWCSCIMPMVSHSSQENPFETPIYREK